MIYERETCAGTGLRQDGERCPVCGREIVPSLTGKTRKHWDERGLADEYVSDPDVTLQDLADRYGFGSRERVRQIAAAYYSDAIERRRAIRQDRQIRTDALRRERARLQAILEGRLCRVCDAPIVRGRRFVTCCSEHAKVWVTIRHYSPQGHQEHREYHARAILNGERAGEGERDWARRVLAGEDGGPNRRYTIPGSEMERLVRKYRPEWLPE